MKQEVRVFFTALMFYTRIPCPKWVDHDPEYINKATRYFPLIGWIVGLVGSITFFIGNLAVGELFGILLSLVATILTTGAFHEDGFADVCDGFGGGWTKEKILEIMKDSRIGVYGVIGLLLILALKVALLLQIADQGFVIFLFTYTSAHALSRWAASTFVYTHSYVRDTGGSKAKPVAKKPQRINLLSATIFGFTPVGIWAAVDANYVVLVTVPLIYLVKAYFARYVTKWIGGYTGDVLGATQQLTEVWFYFMILVLWKFI